MRLFIFLFLIASSTQAKTLSCKVIGISDGDTLTVLCTGNQRIRIRLSEIDAPEKGQPFGQASRKKLSTLCFGKKAEITDRGKDRYGRTLARVHCDGIDANAEMVKSGLAWAYTRYVTDPVFMRYQEEARKKKLGLWQDPNPVPPWQWRPKERLKKKSA